MLTLDITAYFIFKQIDSNGAIRASVITGSVVISGYFVTHYLTMSRNLKERKFEQCLELIKKIRFFILETNIKGTDQHFKMRDGLQDAYFAFALLTSEKSYKALQEMMKEFEIYLLSKCAPDKLCEFKKAQSNFVNNLRKEFFLDKEIDFQTYDFKLERKKEEKELIE